MKKEPSTLPAGRQIRGQPPRHAVHGVPAQFFILLNERGKSKETDKEVTSPLEALGIELKSDFAGRMAIRDMLRAAGLIYPGRPGPSASATV